MRSVATAIGLAICLSANGIPAAAEDSAGGKQEAAGEGGSRREPEDSLVCTKERQAGTHIKKTVCRTRRGIDEERDVSQRWKDSMAPGPGAGHDEP